MRNQLKQISRYGLIFGILLLLLSFLAYRIDNELSVRVVFLFSIFFALCIAGVAINFGDIAAYVKTRSGRRGLEVSLRVLILFCILIIIYILFSLNILSVKADLTRSRKFSMSDKTLSVLGRINEDIDILVFDIKTGGDPVSELLKEYNRASKRISYRFVDAVKHPIEARKYHVSEAGTLVFRAKGKKDIKLVRDDMIKQAYNESGQVVRELRYEQNITAAILSIIETKKSVCYFLEGHGEKSIADHEHTGISKITELLALENVESRVINLTREKKIPNDARIIVITGPRGRLYAYEREMLIEFTEKGGRLLMFADPLSDTKGIVTGLEAITERFGIILRNDLVIDPKNYMPMIKVGKEVMQGGPVYPILEYDHHEIVNGLSRKHLSSVFISTRSLGRSKSMPKGYIFNELLYASESSWGETDLQDAKARYQEGDYKGPLNVGSVVQLGSPDKKNTGSAQKEYGRIAVYGDSDFIMNGIINAPGHSDLVINTVHWLLGQEREISIRVKKEEYADVLLSGAEQVFMFVLFILILPAFIAGVGIVVNIKRRRS
ncbi:GldG family protein [Spirochaetota bacterium]